MRGQLTFEFIITIVFILIIFVVGLAVFESRQNQNFSYFENWAGQNIANKIARNINSAALMDNNGVISDNVVFDLRKISISVSGNSLALYKENYFIDAPLSTSMVVFNITDLNGLIFFRKINGFVVVGYS